MVGAETASSKPSRGIHHHQQVLVPLPPLPGVHRLHVHEEGGHTVSNHSEHRHAVAPGRVVVVGVEQPLSVPAEPTKHRHAEEYQTRHDSLHHEVCQNNIVLKPTNYITFKLYQEEGTILTFYFTYILMFSCLNVKY